MSLVTMGAVNATSSVFQLPDASLVSLGEFLILEGNGGTSELVIVRSVGAGRASSGAITVARGAGGTVAVAHTAPVTLSQYDPSPSGGGGSLAVTGPYTIHYNDAGVDTPPGIELLALDAGSLILGVHVEVPTTWDDDVDQASLGIVAVGNVTAGLGHFLLGDNWALGTPEAGTYNIGGSTSGTFPNSVLLTAPTFRFAVAGHLYASVSNGGSATKGVATVYAIVASPAS